MVVSRLFFFLVVAIPAYAVPLDESSERAIEMMIKHNAQINSYEQRTAIVEAKKKLQKALNDCYQLNGCNAPLNITKKQDSDTKAKNNKSNKAIKHDMTAVTVTTNQKPQSLVIEAIVNENVIFVDDNNKYKVGDKVSDNVVIEAIGFDYIIVRTITTNTDKKITI